MWFLVFLSVFKSIGKVFLLFVNILILFFLIGFMDVKCVIFLDSCGNFLLVLFGIVWIVLINLVFFIIWVVLNFLVVGFLLNIR